MRSKWDNDLTRLLQGYYHENHLFSVEKSNKICGGVCELFRQKVGFDLKITGGNNISVIAMELKLHKQSISGWLLKSWMNSLAVELEFSLVFTLQQLWQMRKIGRNFLPIIQFIQYLVWGFREVSWKSRSIFPQTKKCP